MKKYLAFLTLAIAIVSFNFTTIENSNVGAVMSWNLTEYDFGQIELNRPVTADFKFQNSGTTPLVIVSAQGSCGCTVAEYTKGEILPGEFGEVTATYNAAKVGVFNKAVTVNANTANGPITLRVKGEVVN
ncbi:Protein of unknown function [Reichenbachiella faecimaris]|uniref:DUF1573 domain-containing protein n=1 Tax=Reichenbachiella faecimaris TaxID=692418 RepID=A0A1W2GHT5_REIFA|nr:DUF1573 domain-containing protein [Reichenbachiella faecimaris]SMD35836.1 Protein of unknown function [Reichenbachiella faecimaris]